MIVSPATSPGSPQTSPTGSAPGLGKDDFLKLLVGQLRNQNPMSPAGDQEFIQQMTMFSTLEQVTNLAATSLQVADAVGASRAVALIGRNVTYAKPDGTTAQGVVEQVVFGEDGHPLLTVAGQAGVDPKAVREVR